MLSSISHELNTPLNCSINNLNFIKQNVKLPKEIMIHYLEPALYSNYLLKSIVDDIIDMSAIDQNNLKLHFQLFNLKNLIQECVSYIAYSAKKKSIEINFEYHDNLPLNFYNDPKRIKQIIINLLMNAEKFTQEGNIIIKAKLHKKKFAFIQVLDTGIGISQEKQKLIFNNFGKFNKLQNSQGAGLGLTISYNLSKGISGGYANILVNSQEGQGSNFQFYIKNFEVQKKGLQQEQKQDYSVNSCNTLQFETLENLDFASSIQNVNAFIKQTSIMPEQTQSQILNGEISPYPSRKSLKKLSQEIKDFKIKNSLQQINQPNFFNAQKSFSQHYNKNENNQNFFKKGQLHHFQTLDLDYQNEENNQNNQEESQENVIFDRKQKQKEKTYFLTKKPFTLDNSQFLQRNKKHISIPSDKNISLDILTVLNKIPKFQQLVKLFENQTIILKKNKENITINIEPPQLKDILKQDLKSVITNTKRSNRKSKFFDDSGIKPKTNLFLNGIEQDSIIENQHLFLTQSQKLRSSSQVVSQDSVIKYEVQQVNNNYNNNPSLYNKCQCSNIFIIDDNMMNVQSLQLTLLGIKKKQFKNIKIEYSLSGQQALDIIKLRFQNNQCCPSFKVIFMDIDMPGMDGFQCTKQIIQFYQQQNIIQQQYTNSSQSLQGNSYNELQFQNKILQKQSENLEKSIEIVNNYKLENESINTKCINLQNNKINLPYITACSSYQDQIYKEKAKKAGMRNYVEKPVTPNTIIQILNKQLK